MSDNYLVGLDEYKVLDEDNPLAYTRDIHTCMVLVVHKEKNAILFHVEAYYNEIHVDNLFKVLRQEKDNRIQSVDIFIGEHTSVKNLTFIKSILFEKNIKYNVYKVFVNNSNETSVGYNYSLDEYYEVSMETGNPNFTKKLIK